MNRTTSGRHPIRHQVQGARPGGTTYCCGSPQRLRAAPAQATPLNRCLRGFRPPSTALHMEPLGRDSFVAVVCSSLRRPLEANESVEVLDLPSGVWQTAHISKAKQSNLGRSYLVTRDCAGVAFRRRLSDGSTFTYIVLQQTGGCRVLFKTLRLPTKGTVRPWPSHRCQFCG